MLARSRSGVSELPPAGRRHGSEEPPKELPNYLLYYRCLWPLKERMSLLGGNRRHTGSRLRYVPARVRTLQIHS